MSPLRMKLKTGQTVKLPLRKVLERRRGGLRSTRIERLECGHFLENKAGTWSGNRRCPNCVQYDASEQSFLGRIWPMAYKQ